MGLPTFQRNILPLQLKKKGGTLFIYGTVNNSNFFHPMMKSLMNNELKMMWKGWSCPTFEVLSQNLTRETEENHIKPWSGQLISGLRFKSWTSRIASANHSTVMFSEKHHTWVSV
jgi:hypothetical protein